MYFLSTKAIVIELPVINLLNELSLLENQSIEILDLKGNRLLELKKGSSNFLNLSTGIYLKKTIQNNSISFQKIKIKN